MKVEIEDVLFWMDAIRNSDDRYRTLESFWKGQVRSKVWLIDKLSEVYTGDKPNVVIHGGWNGVLSGLLFNSALDPRHIESVDLDPVCENIAYTINRRYEMERRFTAVTQDMTEYSYIKHFDIVINTSVEHLTERDYNKWFDNIPENSLIVLQSNNYFELPEHINCVSSLDQLINSCGLTDIRLQEVFDTPKYQRYMVIGCK